MTRLQATFVRWGAYSPHLKNGRLFHGILIIFAESQRDAKKRWEEEIRAQIADNEREINHISTPQKERQLHQLDVDKQYQVIDFITSRLRLKISSNIETLV